MSAFRIALAAAHGPNGLEAAPPRRWVFLAYDQLHTRFVDDLVREHDDTPNALGVVLVECPQKAARRPYHQQKLALLLTNTRHFALELAADPRVARVEVLVADDDEGYGDALRRFATNEGVKAMVSFAPAERELRAELAPLVDDGLLVVRPHPGWLTTTEDFAPAPAPIDDDGDGDGASKRGPPWRMDAFYRRVRRRTGLLMDEAGKPLGGRFSMDGENRQRWPGSPIPPTPPRFVPDAITQEVIALVRTHYGHHPGRLDEGNLPASVDDAETLWCFALEHCLREFGPYEDAMSTRSSSLFHTRISPLLNLNRLWPSAVIADVVDREIPLASKEGFVRQVLGWREFVRHVHEHTDGFTRLPADVGAAPAITTGDDDLPLPAPLAQPRFLGADNPLPPTFWRNAWPEGGGVASARGVPKISGLHCLDVVVADVWREAYSHHITRLMVLSNIASLLDVDARALTNWFWVAYADAYDWVVEPNVLGMGTHAAGDVMTTKPYVAGSAYIKKMSDYCDGCAFKPGKSVDVGGCPLTQLYWAYLHRHRDSLATTDRLALPLASCRKRTEDQHAADTEVFQITRRTLAAGETLHPKTYSTTSSAPSSFRLTAPPGKKGRSPTSGPLPSKP